jgi:hypothetical protein
MPLVDQTVSDTHFCKAGYRINNRHYVGQIGNETQPVAAFERSSLNDLRIPDPAVQDSAEL